VSYHRCDDTGRVQFEEENRSADCSLCKTRKVVVGNYSAWTGAARITLSMPDGRKHTLDVAEAETLRADLEAALVDANDVEREVDEMFADEPECRAATHGPRNSTCTCEDSRDE
jgi:hypothetical protein